MDNRSRREKASPPLIGWRDALKDYIRTTLPLASVLAFCMNVFGILVFSVCLYVALQTVVNTFDLSMVGKIVWLILLLHLALAVGLLLLGALASGDMREFTYKQLQKRFGSKRSKLLSRGSHVVGIYTAYFLHFMWLLLPAVLLLPVVLVTGVGVGCRYIPDCVTLSDIGIPPSYTQMIVSERIVNYVRDYDLDQFEDHINSTEVMLNDLLTKVEDAGIVNKVVETIDATIPEKAEIDEYIQQGSDFIEHIDIEPYLDWISDKVNATMDRITNESGQIGQLAEYIDDWDLGEYLPNTTLADVFNQINIPDLGSLTLNVTGLDEVNMTVLAAVVRKQLEALLNKTSELEIETLDRFVEKYLDVQKIAGQVSDTATEALGTAKNAIVTAEEASRKALNQLDDMARYLVEETEEKVKEVSMLVKQYTDIALHKVRQAVKWIKVHAIALMHDAGDLALKLSAYVRHYSEQGLLWARLAVRESAHLARLALTYTQLARTRALEGYAIAKEYTALLGVRQEGEDTFCLDTKIMVCDELMKSSVCFILVFVASIILNLSMVHWLMVLTSNYVHVKQESHVQKKRKGPGHIYKVHLRPESEQKLETKPEWSGELALLEHA